MTDPTHAVPSVTDLDELFEEIWIAAELVGGSDDRRLAPRLVELAEDVAAWRHQRACLRSAPEEDWRVRAPRLLQEMELRLERQRALVARLERIGCPVSLGAARDLLRIMQDCAATARRNVGLLESSRQPFAGIG